MPLSSWLPRPAGKPIELSNSLRVGSSWPVVNRCPFWLQFDFESPQPYGGSLDGAVVTACIEASSSRNMDCPVSIQRLISAKTLPSVKCSIRFERLARTLMMTPRRLAPDSVLLVRAAFRAIASARAWRSLRLFVASTSGCKTNTNSFSVWSTNSFYRSINFASSAGAVSFNISPYRRHIIRIRDCRLFTFACRPPADKRRS